MRASAASPNAPSARRTRDGAPDADGRGVQRRSSVTLVSDGKQLRTELVRYLSDAGFEVELSAFPPPVPDRARSLVWLPDREVDRDVVVAAIADWLDHARRVVLVSWTPRAYREAIEAHGDRLVVLVPPIFGWQLVDALRPPTREASSW